MIVSDVQSTDWLGLRWRKATTVQSRQSFQEKLFFYASYGTPPNGRLKYNAEFEDGDVISVVLKEHRAPDEQAWRERKASGMSQFIVKNTGGRNRII